MKRCSVVYLYNFGAGKPEKGESMLTCFKTKDIMRFNSDTIDYNSNLVTWRLRVTQQTW